MAWRVPVESASFASVPKYRIWYCLRLPYQRGFALPSGRNIPMNTWFSFCDRLVALIGRDAAANTEFTDWIWTMMSRSASRIAWSFLAAK